MTAELTNRLVDAGLSPTAAISKAALFAKASNALRTSAAAAGAGLSFFIPGRIEFLGKHTDYAGGRSLICAIERGICLAASPREDPVLRIIDATRKSETAFTIAPDLRPPSGNWTNYPMTLARRLARNFPGQWRGADIAFVSDLPPAAGLSSSSVLIVGIFSALSKINELQNRSEYRDNIRSLEDLAGYLGAVENGQSFGQFAGDTGVGTFGGSQDQTAILCCRPGQLAQYSFRPVRHERSIDLPADHTFVIGVSGVVAKKTGDAREKYNQTSLRAAALIEMWQRASGRADDTLLTAATHAPDAPDRIRRLLGESSHPMFSSHELLDRFEQFLIETTEIIPHVGDALTRGDIARVGELVDRSQRAVEQLLGNQVPETIWLARSARELGAAAASAFGAGFGGSVWALVRKERAEEFRLKWAEHYRAQFPSALQRSTFFATQAGPAMVRL
jgi:galactokinase